MNYNAGNTAQAVPLVQVPRDHERRVLSVSDVAHYCAVEEADVHKWIQRGQLPASYIPHGRFRIDAGDFMAFMHTFWDAI